MNKGLGLLSEIWENLKSDQYNTILSFVIAGKTVTPKQQFEALYSQCYLMVEDRTEAETLFYMIYQDNEWLLMQIKERTKILKQLILTTNWSDVVTHKGVLTTKNKTLDKGANTSTNLGSSTDKSSLTGETSTDNKTTTKGSDVTTNLKSSTTKIITTGTADTQSKAGSSDGSSYNAAKNSAYLTLKWISQTNTTPRDIPANQLSQNSGTAKNAQNTTTTDATMGSTNIANDNLNVLAGKGANKQAGTNTSATMGTTNNTNDNLNTLDGELTNDYVQESGNTAEDFKNILVLEVAQLRTSFWLKFSTLFNVGI